MARKAVPSTTGRKSSRAAEPDLLAGQPAASPRGRGRKPVPREATTATTQDLPLPDPGGEELALGIGEPGLGLPVVGVPVMGAPVVGAPGVGEPGPAERKGSRRPKAAVERKVPNRGRSEPKPGSAPAPRGEPIGETALPAATDDHDAPGDEQAFATRPPRGRRLGSPPEAPAPKAETGGTDVGAAEARLPLEEPVEVASGSPASAARWDPATGTVTFDWPAIEQVAARDGPNRAMARLLIAARAEGAESRWPF